MIDISLRLSDSPEGRPRMSPWAAERDASGEPAWSGRSWRVYPKIENFMGTKYGKQFTKATGCRSLSIIARFGWHFLDGLSYTLAIPIYITSRNSYRIWLDDISYINVYNVFFKVHLHVCVCVLKHLSWHFYRLLFLYFVDTDSRTQYNCRKKQPLQDL